MAQPEQLSGPEALQRAAGELELLAPMLKHQYVALLRLYAEEPWRLDYEHTEQEKPRG
jgi:hypothetical protein